MRVCRFLVLAVAAVTGMASLAAAQDILIFRPASNSQTEVVEPSIELEIQISAFDVIQEVAINGVIQAITPAHQVRVVSHQSLEPGSNRFLVSAKTESASKTREFHIYRVDALSVPREPGEKILPIQVVALLGAQRNSNVFMSAEDEQSGVKRFVLLLPSFERELESKNRFRLAGIVYREQYDDEALKEAEIQFSRGTGEFQWLFEDRDSFALGAGFNVVDTGYDNPVGGQNQSEEDQFVFARFRAHYSDLDQSTYELEVLRRDRIDPINDDFNEDAIVITAHGAIERQLSQFQTTLKGWVAWDESQGLYSDKYILRAAAGLRVSAGRLLDMGSRSSLNRLTLGAGAGARLRQYKEIDPASGKAERDVAYSGSAGASYALLGSLLLNAEIAREKQTSNVQTASFKNDAAGLSLIYIY